MKNQLRREFKNQHAGSLAYPTADPSWSKFQTLWASLKQDAIDSELHKHASKHGYPIPDIVVKQSDYMNRNDHETRLLNTIINNRNAIIVGCEGSGKSTLIHKVIGHDLYKATGYRTCHPIYLNVRNFGKSTLLNNSGKSIIDGMKFHIRRTFSKKQLDFFKKLQRTSIYITTK